MLALAIVAGFLYGHSLHGPHYGDDLAFVFNDPAAHTLGSFFERNAEHFFRPLDYAYQAFVQTLVGRATWPLHLLGLGLHVLLAALVFAAARSLRMSWLQAGLAAVFMLVAQGAPSAVVGNDTLSQVGGAFFGGLAVWLLYVSLFRAVRQARLLYVLGAVSLGLALLSKETSASFVVIALGLVVARALLSARPRPVAWRDAVVRGLPILILFVGYLILRDYASRADVVFGEDRYAFHLGLNIVENLAQFGLAALLPASSATAFVAFHTGRFFLLGALLLAALAAAVAIGVGLWRARRLSLTVALIGCGALALFPAVLLNHVSELYLYNALPFVSLLVGLGLGTLLASVRPGLARMALAFGVVAFFGGHGAASWSKADLMRQNGERAERLLAEVVPCLQRVPPNALVRLVNTPEARLTYSVYVLPEFNVLRIGEASVARLAGRPDVEVRVVDPAGTFNPDLDLHPEPNVPFVLSLPYGEPVSVHCSEAASQERTTTGTEG